MPLAARLFFRISSISARSSLLARWAASAAAWGSMISRTSMTSAGLASPIWLPTPGQTAPAFGPDIGPAPDPPDQLGADPVHGARDGVPGEAVRGRQLPLRGQAIALGPLAGLDPPLHIGRHILGTLVARVGLR